MSVEPLASLAYKQLLLDTTKAMSSSCVVNMEGMTKEEGPCLVSNNGGIVRLACEKADVPMTCEKEKGKWAVLHTQHWLPTHAAELRHAHEALPSRVPVPRGTLGPPRLCDQPQ